MTKLSAEKEAIKAVNTYIKGLNDKDPAKLANSLHFPHIRSMKDGTFFEEKPCEICPSPYRGNGFS